MTYRPTDCIPLRIPRCGPATTPQLLIYLEIVSKAGDRKFRDETTVASAIPTGRQPLLGAVLRPVNVAGEPAEFRLQKGTCRIGAGGNNDLVINHRTVSRSHVELSLTPEGVLVRDLGSRNGTLYLGQRIGTMVLGLGASIHLGEVIVAIEPDTESLLVELDYPGDDGYRGILGVSSRMRKLFALLRKLESSLATVVIEGESGAGKEGVARAIHEGSPVAKGPLVVLNCGAISKELVASELFGHRRGAFTGAVDTRRGAFDSADGGTLFLDEVGELPIEVQPALLRALEVGEIRPLGTDETHRTKVRVIAATHRDLQSEVLAGRFREDLFYRLAVVRVQVPPLRARPEDIEVLARHFAKAIGAPDLPAHIVEELKSRAWPGNARELRNALQSYAAIGQLPPAPASLAARVDAPEDEIDPTIPYPEQKDRVVEQFTRAYVKALLRYTNGNQAAAARIGKLDRTTLNRLMNKYGMHVRRIE
jgi:DNA-binding NtrC family response regulator